MGLLLNRGFDSLMAEQRIPDLARFYNLAARVQALPALKLRLKDFIRTSGLALIMDEEKVPLLPICCTDSLLGMSCASPTSEA